MLAADAGYFADLVSELTGLEVIYESAELERNGRLTATNIKDIQGSIKKALTFCRKLGMRSSVALLQSRTGRRDVPQTWREFDLLREAIHAEFWNFLVVVVEPARMGYLSIQSRQAYPPENIIEKFPSAAGELRSAGSCYAFEEPTACVFHAMRAAELGLRLLATELKVPLDKPIEQSEWMELLNGIAGRIREIENQPRKTSNRDEDLRFYSESSAQLRFFKNGWRIRVMHARATYTDGQAKETLDHVVSLFSVLSERLSEPLP